MMGSSNRSRREAPRARPGLTRRQFVRSAPAAIAAVAALWIARAAVSEIRPRSGPAASVGQEGRKSDAKTAKKRVVIVTGIDYPGHKWRETAPVLAKILGQHPALRVEVVEDPAFLASPRLRDYDGVVLHFMNWERPDPGAAARENLRRFVAGGKGVVLVHFACGAFQEWTEFANLAGRVWDPKLRGHDPRGPFRVRITEKGRTHPATRGLKDFETDDELYTCLRGERPVDLLAVATSKVDGKDYPMAFSFSYGEGRVFHSPLGHDVKALKLPGPAELFRRGCAWAVGIKVAAGQATGPREPLK